MAPINNLSSGYLQSVLSTALQSTGLTTKTAANDISNIGAPSDHGQFSPFAQLISTLQQLQQSDPNKYQQVTQQIAANLQSAAQTAQAQGNSTAANQLNQLAADFTGASTSGQLPNIQDLAQAIGGRHQHQHHHFSPASADPDSNSIANPSSSGATSASSASQPLSQLLSAFQTNGAQTDSLNPIAIVLNTLSNAGISGSNAR